MFFVHVSRSQLYHLGPSQGTQKTTPPIWFPIYRPLHATHGYSGIHVLEESLYPPFRERTVTSEKTVWTKDGLI